MKFIHTSDWHIGRLLHGMSLLDDQSYVLNQLIEQLKAESVDALIIAGDVYDRAIPPANAVELLDDVLDKICSELHIPVILIPGNHDSAERLNFGSRQLSQAGLHILGSLEKITEPVPISDGVSTAYFYGIPYNDPVQVRNVFDTDVSTYDEANRFLIETITASYDQNQFNVLLSHCFVEGGEESDSERTLSIGGADRVSINAFKAFDYVALGHLHRPQYKGEKTIRYSGSLLKYSFSEQSHDKGVTLVEIDVGTLREIRHIPLKPPHEMRSIEGEFAKILEAGAIDPNNEDYLSIHLTDKHAIMDPMNQLRQVYPNVLHLSKYDGSESSEQRLRNRKKLQGSALDMFKEFYRNVSGDDLTSEQEAAIRKTVDAIHSAH